jgi:hypothetical protein
LLDYKHIITCKETLLLLLYKALWDSIIKCLDNQSI